jgi:hypothetical protein
MEESWAGQVQDSQPQPCAVEPRSPLASCSITMGTNDGIYFGPFAVNSKLAMLPTY